MSIKEIRERVSRDQAELARLEKIDTLKRADENRRRMRVVQGALTPELIDAIEPDHNPGRYNSDCSDENPCGMERVREHIRKYGSDKENRCDRCALLEFVSAEPSEGFSLNISLEY